MNAIRKQHKMILVLLKPATNSKSICIFTGNPLNAQLNTKQTYVNICSRTLILSSDQPCFLN